MSSIRLLEFRTENEIQLSATVRLPNEMPPRPTFEQGIAKLSTKKEEILANQNIPDLFRSIKLLLVEDNIINQTIMSTFFRKMGLEFKIAANGAEAVELFEHEKFHLIFMGFLITFHFIFKM